MNTFSKFFKKFYVIGQFPNIDWQRIFIFFTCVALALVVWSSYIFMDVKNEVVEVDPGVGSARLAAETRDKEIADLLIAYEAKEERHARLQTSPVSEVSASSSASLKNESKSVVASSTTKKIDHSVTH